MSGFSNDTCPHCFRGGFTNGTCRACGYKTSDNKNDVNSLQPFTVIAGKYIIGHCIGAGGFGITYTAFDLSTQRRCALKEFFPSNIAYRDIKSGVVTCGKENEREYVHGMQRFYDEAKVLASLKDQADVVKILAYLKANNTAYIVMEFVDGVTLKKQYRNQNCPYEFNEAKRIFLCVARALRTIHSKKLLHRDMTPENVMICKDGSIKILDFGSARDYIRNATGMSVMVKRGYAPIEQYSSEKRQGPFTDIYSLCCMTYFLITGQYVPDAFDRVNGKPVPRLDTIAPNVPEKFAMVIEKGMMVSPGDRYQTVDEMLNDLGEQHGVDYPPRAPIYVPPVGPGYPVPPKPTGGFWYKVKRFFGIGTEDYGGNYGGGGFNNQSYQDERSQTPPEILGTFNPPPFPPAPGFKPIFLRIDSGPAAGFSYRIDGDGSYTVGRSVTQCNVTIDGNFPEISRLHCIITSQEHGSKIFVEDKSANGTYSTSYGRLEPNKPYLISPGEILYLASNKYAMRVVK